jgi:hypothetical protein
MWIAWSSRRLPRRESRQALPASGGHLDRRGAVIGGEPIPARKAGHGADVADDRGGGFREERNLRESCLPRRVLEASKCLRVRGGTVLRVCSGEDHRMAEHHALDGRAVRFVRLALQALQNHADQRTDGEVGGPRVGAGETELGKLVLHP